MTDHEKEGGRVPVQMVIDPETGEDITAKVIATRLRELEIFADGRIDEAGKKAAAAPESTMRIFKEYYWLLHERIGVGSIGPATAAAGPLLETKQRELAERLGIDYETILESGSLTSGIQT